MGFSLLHINLLGSHILLLFDFNRYSNVLFLWFYFGATTTLAPLLIFMPFTGQGFFAKNTDRPIKTSIVFLIRHSVYGMAIYEGFRWFGL